jgi:GNAT superfamily N-acetyltransferase
MMSTDPQSEIVVRLAQAADAPVLVEFQKWMAWETERLRLDDDRVSAGVAAIFDDPAKGRYYVAEHQGQLAGMLLTIPEWSDWRNATVVWLHSVYVRTEFRRQGVFRQMFQHVQREVLASPALAGLRLYVEKRNSLAQRVYAELGMTPDHYAMFEWLK